MPRLYFSSISKNFQKNIDEAEQAVAKQKSKKKKHVNLAFFLINILVIAIILAYQITQQNDMSITALLHSTFSPMLFLALIGVWLFMQLVDAYRTNILLKNATGRSRPCLAYKTNCIGRYYDYITPMATGGQPFQIFYLKNRGLNAASAISVPMGRYVSNQLCLSVIWTVVIMVAIFTKGPGELGYTTILCIIGWALNSLLMVTILILSINQKVGKKIVIGTLRLLQKIHLLKDYEKSYKQVIKIVTDFQSTLKSFLKEFKTFVKIMVSNLILMVIQYSMAFFVYCVMVGHVDFSMYLQIFMLNVLIDMAASFFPLPGGTGVSELSFTALFSLVISDGSMLTWALIIWRVMTYYIYLIQGILIMAYDNAFGNRRFLWTKKKWALQEESTLFNQDLIHDFNFDSDSKSRKIF